MAYETIAIRKLTPAIGAEVSGVDLASLSNQQASELHDALMTLGYVVDETAYDLHLHVS